MIKSIIRLFAFFWKEIHEVRRQPRLVLSLILGPFMILLLFGLGYRSDRPPLRVSLVLPVSIQDEARIDAIRQVVDENLDLVSVYHDVDRALTELYNDRVDLVEVIPEEINEDVFSGERGSIEFIYNEINPQEIQYIQYVSYLQAEVVNTTLLMYSVADLQGEARTAQNDVESVRQEIQSIDQAVEERDIDQAEAALQNLEQSLSVLANNPLYAALVLFPAKDNRGSVDDLEQIQLDIQRMKRAIDAGQIEQQREAVNALDNRLAKIDTDLDRVQGISPEAVVAPVKQNYQNLQEKPTDLMTFFAPSVFALILQHIAVTLGALSLVRERTRGALEFFGVAPITRGQVIVGKYLAYILFLGIIGAILLGLMVFLLRIPFIGDPYQFTIITILFLLASTGIGFLVSVLSKSENQAVQLSMLVLLMSVFFSGFVSPLDYFQPAFRYIGYVLPMTHANQAYLDVQLKGIYPGWVSFAALAAIAVLAFLLVNFIWRNQFRSLEA